MDHSFFRAYITFCICLGIVSFCCTQSIVDANHLELYDALVGRENTGLFNGPQFKDENLHAWDDSHIYFGSANYVSSNLVYNGQLYIDVPLRYDIFGDNVSIRSSDHLSIFKIRLIPESTAGFSIDDRHFTRLLTTGLALPGHGFFEISFIGDNYALYTKHLKRKKRETVNKVLQYRFVNENYYLLWVNNSYHTIYSIKDFKQIIPDRYMQVRNFRKQNKSLYKNHRDAFMIALIKDMDIQQTLLKKG